VIESRSTDPLVGDESGAVGQSPRQCARAAARGFVLLAAVSIAIGLMVTYLGMLEPLRTWDVSVNERLADGRSANLDSVAGVISRLGDTFGIIGLVVVISAGLAFARQFMLLALVPLALLIEVVTFLTVNYVVQRPRPGVPPVGSVPSTFSFPSGHVAATLACWLGLAVVLHTFGHRRTAIVVACFAALAAIAMAWARLYEGMHHPTDVVAGVAVGLASTAIAARAVTGRDRVV
jgi:membrane-associated phospholipid phosphatase